jgi:hypothetical protein
MIKRTMLAAATGIAVLSQPASAFERGQRWSCVTDQGDPAFLEIHDFKDGTVNYSWGRVDSATTAILTLCKVRDRLVLGEIKDFCRLLGTERSAGHDRLSAACREKSAQ